MECRDDEKAVGEHAKERCSRNSNEDGSGLVDPRRMRAAAQKRSGGERHRVHQLYSKEDAFDPADETASHITPRAPAQAEAQFCGGEDLR